MKTIIILIVVAATVMLVLCCKHDSINSSPKKAKQPARPIEEKTANRCSLHGISPWLPLF